jgi:hypothetical protein
MIKKQTKNNMGSTGKDIIFSLKGENEIFRILF